MNSTPSPTAIADPPAPRRRRRRLLKIIAVLLVVLVALILITPTALSNSLLRGKIADEMSAQFGAPVTIESLSLGWFSGFALEGLEIANPDGFPAEQRAVRLAEASGDFSLLSLLRGRFNVEATVNKLEVNVFQLADGRSNFEELFGAGAAEIEAEFDEDAPDQKDEVRVRTGEQLNRLRLDLKLVDGNIEIRHENGDTIESLRNIHAAVQKEYGGSDLRVNFDAVLHRPNTEKQGRVSVIADVDATLERPVVVNYDILGLDLARYRPLLGAFVPAEQVTAFAGVVGGNGQATVDMITNRVELEGTITVDKPHFAGAMFSDLDIREQQWTLKPNLVVEMREEGELPLIDAEGLHIDLGFVVLDGLAATTASALTAGKPALGVNFDVDVGRLAEMGGPIPAELRGAKGRATGAVALAIDEKSFDPEYLAENFQELLAADINLDVDQISVAEHVIKGIGTALSVRGNKASLTANAMVAGGKATVGLDFDPSVKGEWPANLKLSVDGSKLVSSSVPLMRYAIPLLAGVTETGGDFQGVASCEMELSGPLLAAAEESVLDWLNHWAGDGKLAVVDGSFSPSAELQPMLKLAGGGDGRLSFKNLTTNFKLADGFIETSLLKFHRAAAEIGLKGKTGLNGSIDYRIDLADELRRHKQGKQILKALGGKLPTAALTGTLDEPQLELPDFGTEVENLLENAANDLLKKGLDGLFKKK